MNFLLDKVFLINEVLARRPEIPLLTPDTNGGGRQPLTPRGVISDEEIMLRNPLGVDTIGEVISEIIRFLVVIGAPIMVIMVLIAGFQIMSAGGNPEKINQGRNTILYAVIGYGIILLAQGLVFILEQLLG